MKHREWWLLINRCNLADRVADSEDQARQMMEPNDEIHHAVEIGAVAEQCRLNAIGQERELKLMAEVERRKKL